MGAGHERARSRPRGHSFDSGLPRLVDNLSHGGRVVLRSLGNLVFATGVSRATRAPERIQVFVQLFTVSGNIPRFIYGKAILTFEANGTPMNLSELEAIPFTELHDFRITPVHTRLRPFDGNFALVTLYNRSERM